MTHNPQFKAALEALDNLVDEGFLPWETADDIVEQCKEAIRNLPVPEVGDGWMEKIAKKLHYPECWDTAAYPTIYDALYELASCVDHPKPKVDVSNLSFAGMKVIPLVHLPANAVAVSVTDYERFFGSLDCVGKDDGMGKHDFVPAPPKGEVK